MSTEPSPDPSLLPTLTRRSALAALGGAAATALAAPAWAVDAVRPGAVAAPALTARDRVVVQRVSAARAIEHIVELSEGVGPRIGGTPSERAAADYLAGVLDSYGYDVRLEPFPVADKFLAEVMGSPALDGDICWQAGASPQAALDTTVTGPVVDALDGTGGGDLSGAVVLVDTPLGVSTAVRTQRVQAAVARGAAAVLVLPADPTDPIRRAQAASVALSTPVAVPVVGVATVQKYRLREALARGPMTLTVRTQAFRGLTSHNVLAERAGRGRPDGSRPALMVCAHYDSVIGAPGANDDGSGTALTVEIARVMRSLPTEADLRFSLWGSEEQGLIGSRFHVAQLDQAERDRLLGVYNNDMVATSWDPATRYWVLSWDGSANVINQSVIAAAERLGYAPSLSPVTTRGASDHQSFQERGIASSNFSWRGEASPALLEPPYHSPEDTVAKNISPERMQVSLELIGSALYEQARAV
ncbi:M28 family peptidase [Aquipuribacter nitratireducens]|uniref:M28 family peptidase n=1 Tax=Aquipuribacter nitratireducens TaxID=650104 RepID=A0ABW0GIX2_9MICO